MGAEVENVVCSTEIGPAERSVRARRRSLAHGAVVAGVAADGAAIRVALCRVGAVAIWDGGTGLLAGASVSVCETLRETRSVG